MTNADYERVLEKVQGLREFTRRYMPTVSGRTECASVMEFVLDGLHQNSKIAKDEIDHLTTYKDMVGSIFSGPGKGLEED
jgi:magnesium chelatase subunit I